MAGIKPLLSIPSLTAQWLIIRDLIPFIRIHFLYAAAESGLLDALSPPASRDEVIRALSVRRPELLDALLSVGLSLKELAVKRGLFRIKGRRSRALAAAEGDPLRAVVEEFVGYHGSVYRNLAGRLRGGPLGNYLEGMGDMIARSSMIIEPFVKGFHQALVRKRKPSRILEIGCGTGVYLRQAAATYSGVSGIGIDIQRDVVERAARNLRSWGLDDRFKVMQLDIRDAGDRLGRDFDLITLYNNVYYFTLDERRDLFRGLRSRLAAGGALAVVSSVQGRGALTNDFDLILRSTAGCAPLPELRETERMLLEAGFRSVRSQRLALAQPLCGIIAT